MQPVEFLTASNCGERVSQLVTCFSPVRRLVAASLGHREDNCQSPTNLDPWTSTHGSIVLFQQSTQPHSYNSINSVPDLLYFSPGNVTLATPSLLDFLETSFTKLRPLA